MSSIEVTQKYTNNDQSFLEFVHQMILPYAFIVKSVDALNIIESVSKYFLM